MKENHLKYLVIENSEHVCRGLIERMNTFPDWYSLGFTKGITDSISVIDEYHPQLIFLDWDLSGGSAFEILQYIENIQDYNPYIIFNTGFQKDNPDIPSEIINTYHVDKYLIKPVWENLRQNLATYLHEAKKKADYAKIDLKSNIWIDSVDGKVQINIGDLSCINQSNENPRMRELYFVSQSHPVKVKMTWKECEELLHKHNIQFYIIKQRAYLIVRNYVLKYNNDFVWVDGFPYKLNLVKENTKAFKEWFKMKSEN